MIKFKTYTVLFLIAIMFINTSCSKREVFVVVNESVHERVAFGTDKLVEALDAAGYTASIVNIMPETSKSNIVVVGNIDDKFISPFSPDMQMPASKEGFSIRSVSDKTTVIAGFDASGTLYGCMELIDRIKSEEGLPESIDFIDSPAMVLRGTCIGLQKTTYLPGRQVYEYPYTPETFPWFYDKDLWIEYLDMMVENRYNSLYLWNGHPFSSLVKLPDYPYAVEVDDETFAKNEEIFAFLTEEANRRGIWVIQMFYNIILPKPFAEKHGLETQSRSRGITPLIADYTRKSIAAFISKYPNVGLLVTLGEAMNTIDDDVEWFTKTIIPGVQDGLDSIGTKQQPPIVLRGHDTDASKVMAEALPIYSNLYTMYKYNGESLTTYEPRNQWESIPKALSELGSVHISNVHILANLEPFRYGSPDFIRKSVNAMHDIQGANGLHLYPQASYWDWPYTADKAEPRIREIDRDWIWYKAWGRYAWNCNRDESDENEYWKRQMVGFYGCDDDAAADIVEAYEQTGEIAPKLLRRFGISDGNRQSLLLGMFMSQLVNPFKWNVYQSFLESNGPEGEILVDYARKEWNKEPHTGETPPQIADEVIQHAELAVESIERASSKIGKNVEEFGRLHNDVLCYNAIANFFKQKEIAAEYVLKYKYSNNIEDLEKATPSLEKSVEYYAELVNLTKDSYLYCNSMQTQQRRIPIAGIDGTNKTWEELLPQFEDELNNFKRNIEMLKISNGENLTKVEPYNAVDVEIHNANVKRYRLMKGGMVNTDKNYTIEDVAPELQNLSGVMFAEDEQRGVGTTLRFSCKKPVKVVVGYFNGNSLTILPPPTLETNALANDRGQADIRIANAMLVKGLYPVNVYTYNYEAGDNELALGKGRVLILGFIDASEEIKTHDAGISASEDGVPVDWLFY